MKIKSVSNFSAGNVLTEQELKSIVGGETFKCICTYDGKEVHSFYTNSEASCDSGVCNQWCPQSLLCGYELKKESGSGSGSGYGSGYGS